LTRVYKILSRASWDIAVRANFFAGSQVDMIDGFIHFSTAAQAQETAAKHFAGQEGLVIVGFDAADLGDSLRWEPSRNGALFPHLYGVLDPSLALEVRPLSLDADGAPQIGDLNP
jgi:uncharacterized protein (DUF952 family)